MPPPAESPGIGTCSPVRGHRPARPVRAGRWRRRFRCPGFQRSSRTWRASALPRPSSPDGNRVNRGCGLL